MKDVRILKLRAHHDIDGMFRMGQELDFMAETVARGHSTVQAIQLTLLPLGRTRTTCIRYDSLEQLMDHWDITASRTVTDATHNIFSSEGKYQQIEKT